MSRIAVSPQLTALPAGPGGSHEPGPPLTAPRRYLGRQPILDAHRRLFGYELLYRPGKANVFSGDPEQATREVIDHWLLLIPDPAHCASFVNCTRNTLTEGLVTLLPAQSTVLEILEGVDPDAELLSCCHALKKQGYRFALDGFLPNSSRAPFLEFADFVKVDFNVATYDLRHEIYAMAHGAPALFVAEKIETDIQLRIAISEGCTLFQGYFLAQPVVLASHSIPQNHFVYLKLFAELERDPAHMRKIEKLISADAALCYRVLRLANSASQGHTGVISTIREALLMVGEDAVRKLVTVAMAGVLSASRSPALLSMALARARFCELLAPTLSAEPASFYLLGLLSLLDVLFEMPLGRILETIPIGPEMKSALEGDRSPGGCALSLIRALEACDWHACELIQLNLGLAEGVIAAHYAQALRWASSMMSPELA
jgi:EAL and modified HD-GYP domain-containing signal transduction protein